MSRREKGVSKEEERKRYITTKVIYWLLVIVVIIPFLSPLGLPMQEFPKARDFLKVLEDLEPGDVLVFDVSLPPPSIGEIESSLYTVPKYLADSKRGVKVIVTTIYYGGECDALILSRVLPVFEDAGWEYGEDYVYLGYVPSAETAAAALASNMRTKATEYFGTPIDDLPIMEGVNDASDVAVVFEFSSYDWADLFVRHWNMPYGTKIITAGIGAVIPKYIMFYQAGQIQGMLESTPGCAYFEELTGYIGVAAKTQETLSTSQIFVIIFVVLGNIGYLVAKRREEK